MRRQQDRRRVDQELRHGRVKGGDRAQGHGQGRQAQHRDVHNRAGLRRRQRGHGPVRPVRGAVQGQVTHAARPAGVLRHDVSLQRQDPAASQGPHDYYSETFLSAAAKGSTSEC